MSERARRRAGALLAESNEASLIENMETYSSSLQCLQNIVKQEPGGAEQLRNSRKQLLEKVIPIFICVYGPIKSISVQN